MFGLSHALSSFNSNARNARPLLPMRKGRNRVLGCALDSLPDSLANTADQAAARGCLHTTGIGRLFVVYHGQAGGNDRSVVDWLEHYHGSISASSRIKPTDTFYFSRLRLRWHSASISTGITGCVLTSSKLLTGTIPDRSWSSLNFFLTHDLASYIGGLWNGVKLTALQIQLAFGNLWDGNLLSWGLALAAYILVALAAIKKSPRTPDNAIGDSRRGLTDRTALGSFARNGITDLRIHDYASLHAAQSSCVGRPLERRILLSKRHSHSHCCASDCILVSQPPEQVE